MEIPQLARRARLWPLALAAAVLLPCAAVAQTELPHLAGDGERLDVGMFKIIDLLRFLEEITPLLERRLKKRGWHCSIALRGETHRAGLTIRGKRVTVSRRLPTRADITLAGHDRAITQVVAGIHSPMEPYLQLDLQITPSLNRHVLDLLETLFPTVEKY